MEENILGDIDKEIVEDLDADDKTDAEHMGNPLLGNGPQSNNKIQNEDDNMLGAGGPAATLANMIKRKSVASG